jgi:hypothetical protein
MSDDDRVRALTLRIGQLREQRDQARREVLHCRAGRELEQNGLRNAVEIMVRMRAIHVEMRHGGCRSCGQSYPCPTIRALDGA